MIVIDDGGYCSGALIEPDKILTTAQCIKGYDLI
jgi:V8-like Glu-specific endopeptidase